MYIIFAASVIEVITPAASVPKRLLDKVNAASVSSRTKEL